MLYHCRTNLNKSIMKNIKTVLEEGETTLLKTFPTDQHGAIKILFNMLNEESVKTKEFKALGLVKMIAIKIRYNPDLMDSILTRDLFNKVEELANSK